jgi:hypothetical protein
MFAIRALHHGASKISVGLAKCSIIYFHDVL